MSLLINFNICCSIFIFTDFVKMASLTLKISPGLSDTSVTKTIHFDPTILVYDACRIIRNKLPMVQTNGN